MFKKDIQPDCAYCSFGHLLNNREHCICKKHGFVERKNKCRSFRYDPLLREPTTKPEIPALEEFEIPG